MGLRRMGECIFRLSERQEEELPGERKKGTKKGKGDVGSKRT